MTDYAYSNSCFNNARFYRHDNVTVLDMYQGFLHIPEWKAAFATNGRIDVAVLESDLFWMQMMERPPGYPEPDLSTMMRTCIKEDFPAEYLAFETFFNQTRNFAADKYDFIIGGQGKLLENIHDPYWKTCSKIIIRQGLCDLVMTVPGQKLSRDHAYETLGKQYDHPLCWVELLQENNFLNHPDNLWLFITSLDPQLDHLLTARSHFKPEHWRGAAQQALPKPEVSNLLLSAIQQSIPSSQKDLTVTHLAAGACTHPRIRGELQALNQEPDLLLKNLKNTVGQNWSLTAPGSQSNPVEAWPSSLCARESFGEWYSRSGAAVNISTLPRIDTAAKQALVDITQRARHHKTGDAVISDAMQYLLNFKPPDDKQISGPSPVSHAFLEAGFPESMFYQWQLLANRSNIVLPTPPIVLLPARQEQKMYQYKISDNAFQKALDRFTRNLTAIARTTPFPDALGRDEELRDVIRGVASRRCHGVLIVGRPGVGKSALSKSYANMIVRGEVPEDQRNIQVLEMNIEAMTAGANQVGDFDQNFLDLFQGITERNQSGATHIVLNIPEAHTIFGAGTYDGQPIGAEQKLKKWLDGGALKVILDVDTSNFNKYLAKDEALVRRFHKIDMDEPNYHTVIKIMRDDAAKAEKHYKIVIPEDGLHQIYRYSKRFFKNFGNPDVSLKLLDDAASLASSCGDLMLSGQRINEVVAKQANVSVDFLTRDAKGLLTDLERGLVKQIVEQPDSISGLLRAATVSQAGLKSPDMPIASLLFVGPTGVGKTETALVLAEIMTGSRENLVRIDMSEFMTVDSINKLLGTPPGFTDGDRPGILTAPVRQHPNRVIVFDEIEKAHPDVLNLLLQITDAGRLTDGKGNVVDFSNCWVIATTNVGAEQALKIIRGSHMGFDSDENNTEAQLQKNVQKTLQQAVQQQFRPELLNRMEIVPFHFLTKNAMPVLLSREVNKLNQMLIQEYNITVNISETAEKALVEAGFNQEYGARPLRRAVLRLLTTPISEVLLRHQDDLAPGSQRTYTVEDIGEKFALSENMPAEIIDIPVVVPKRGAKHVARAANSNAHTLSPPKYRM